MSENKNSLNSEDIKNMLYDEGFHIFSIGFILKSIKSFLTDRQFNIIRLKVKNFKNIEIAKKLDVSPATITIEFEKIRKVVNKHNLL